MRPGCGISGAILTAGKRDVEEILMMFRIFDFHQGVTARQQKRRGQIGIDNLAPPSNPNSSIYAEKTSAGDVDQQIDAAVKQSLRT
jgi:hypothetical protein